MSKAAKKDACASHKSNGAPESAEGRDRPGMPDNASVLSEKAFKSPKGKHYRIIRTDEKDPYDAPAPPKPCCTESL
jgi:hypothetical protein